MEVTLAHQEVVADAYGAEAGAAHHSKGVLAHKHVAVQLVHPKRRHVFDRFIPASFAQLLVELKAIIAIAIFKLGFRLFNQIRG